MGVRVDVGPGEGGDGVSGPEECLEASANAAADFNDVEWAWRCLELSAVAEGGLGRPEGLVWEVVRPWRGARWWGQLPGGDRLMVGDGGSGEEGFGLGEGIYMLVRDIADLADGGD